MDYIRTRGSHMAGPLHALDQAFEELYNSLPELLGHAFVEEQSQEKSLPLLAQGEQRLTHELGVEIASLRHRCRNGLHEILKQLKSSKEPEILGAVPVLEGELSKRLYGLLSSPTFTQIILRVVSGESWREALRFPKDSLDVLYKGAKMVFEDGRFIEATDCFSFLSWFDARQYDFWMALGHSQFHTANHSAAISSYGIASYCFPSDSWPHIYSATCFEALGDFDQAVRSMTEGLDVERKKESPDRDLMVALEHKIEQYRQKVATPIS